MAYGKIKESECISQKKKKAIIYISTEGNNKTEEIYFHHFGGRDKDYLIKFAKGNHTDPCGILKAAKEGIRKEELDLEDDAVYCVFDVDTVSWRHNAIREALKEAEKEQINVILSNPCFEIWFLLHYVYTSRCFGSNEEVLRALRSHLPSYEKNEDIFDLLSGAREKAMRNARRLQEYHGDNGVRDEIKKNPSTDVYQLIEEFYR